MSVTTNLINQITLQEKEIVDQYRLITSILQKERAVDRELRSYEDSIRSLRSEIRNDIVYIAELDKQALEYESNLRLASLRARFIPLVPSVNETVTASHSKSHKSHKRKKKDKKKKKKEEKVESMDLTKNPYDSAVEGPYAQYGGNYDYYDVETPSKDNKTAASAKKKAAAKSTESAGTKSKKKLASKVDENYYDENEWGGNDENYEGGEGGEYYGEEGENYDEYAGDENYDYNEYAENEGGYDEGGYDEGGYDEGEFADDEGGAENAKGKN
jgi:hypothetical protein